MRVDPDVASDFEKTRVRFDLGRGAQVAGGCPIELRARSAQIACGSMRRVAAPVLVGLAFVPRRW
jgi:hypothetical protein